MRYTLTTLFHIAVLSALPLSLIIPEPACAMERGEEEESVSAASAAKVLDSTDRDAGKDEEENEEGHASADSVAKAPDSTSRDSEKDEKKPPKGKEPASNPNSSEGGCMTPRSSSSEYFPMEYFPSDSSDEDGLGSAHLGPRIDENSGKDEEEPPKGEETTSDDEMYPTLGILPSTDDGSQLKSVLTDRGTFVGAGRQNKFDLIIDRNKDEYRRTVEQIGEFQSQKQIEALARTVNILEKGEVEGVLRCLKDAELTDHRDLTGLYVLVKEGKMSPRDILAATQALDYMQNQRPFHPNKSYPDKIANALRTLLLLAKISA